MSRELRAADPKVNFRLTAELPPRDWSNGGDYSCRVEDVRLDPMTIEEFEARIPAVMDGYVAEQIRAGNWSAVDAGELARVEQHRLLPLGIATPGMHWYIARTQADEIVGYLWLATEPTDPITGGAWIYAIEVEPGYRGRGLGHQLLDAAELEARRLGARAIALNVFGANHVARQLYESSGYEVTSLQMRKTLH